MENRINPRYLPPILKRFLNENLIADSYKNNSKMNTKEKISLIDSPFSTEFFGNDTAAIANFRTNGDMWKKYISGTNYHLSILKNYTILYFTVSFGTTNTVSLAYNDTLGFHFSITDVIFLGKRKELLRALETKNGILNIHIDEFIKRLNKDSRSLSVSPFFSSVFSSISIENIKRKYDDTKDLIPF